MKRASIMLRSVFLLGLAGALACSKAPDPESPAPSFRIEDFSRQWVHSIEEQQSFDDPVQIYRPDGFKEFPPSMYRKRYVFERDGSAQYLWPSPADAHEMRPATWKIDAQKSDVIHVQEGDQMVSYQVLEVTPDLLRMRLLTE